MATSNRLLTQKDWGNKSTAQKLIERAVRVSGSEQSYRDRMYVKKVLISYMANNTKLSLTNIALLTGLSTHSAVIHHRDDVSNITVSDKPFASFIDNLFTDITLAIGSW